MLGRDTKRGYRGEEIWPHTFDMNVHLRRYLPTKLSVHTKVKKINFF